MPPAPDPLPQPLDHLALRGVDAAPALVLRGETLSWQDLRTRVARLAGWLRTEVPEPGARVAAWAAKGELTCLMPLAAARAGLVHVPINPLLKRAQVAHIVADSGAALLLATEARLASLEPGDVPASCRMLTEEAALQSAVGVDGLGPSSADPGALAAILYTSGSTGRPKGVMLSHANLWLGAVSVAHYLKLERDDVTLAVLPLSFDYGQNQLLSTWYAGGCGVPLEYLTPRDVIKACARHGVTTLAAVPPLWAQLLEHEWPPEALVAMRRLTNSGGALTRSLVTGLRSRFPKAELYAMYGITEAFRSTYLEPHLIDEHPEAIGRAIPFAEVAVVLPDGTRADPGQAGEIVHAGPLVSLGYWRDPERMSERFRPAPAWFEMQGTAVWSGDIGVIGEDGLLRFVGRNDEMIKSSGNRISPQEVEEAVVAGGETSEAVALGLPDERLGQAVVVVARGDGAAEPALRERLRRDLPTFMQPKQYHWRRELPRNANGKHDRAKLRAELTA